MSLPHHTPKERGWQAYGDGSANPYRDSDPRHDEWCDGYDLAKRMNHRGQ